MEGVTHVPVARDYGRSNSDLGNSLPLASLFILHPKSVPERRHTHMPEKTRFTLARGVVVVVVVVIAVVVVVVVVGVILIKRGDFDA